MDVLCKDCDHMAPVNVTVSAMFINLYFKFTVIRLPVLNQILLWI